MTVENSSDATSFWWVVPMKLMEPATAQL